MTLCTCRQSIAVNFDGGQCKIRVGSAFFAAFRNGAIAMLDSAAYLHNGCIHMNEGRCTSVTLFEACAVQNTPESMSCGLMCTLL